jgi:hypothetical protein
MVRGGAHEHADAPHPLGLLRPRRERPRGRRTADERYELSPPHELPSDEARNLAHKRACASQRNLSAYVGSGSNLCRLRISAARLLCP